MAWYDDANQTLAIREYGSRAAMEKESRRAAERGWEIVSTTSKIRRQFWKLFLVGIGWLLWPTTGFIVTYRRPPPASR